MIEAIEKAKTSVMRFFLTTLVFLWDLISQSHFTSYYKVYAKIWASSALATFAPCALSASKHLNT